MSENEDESRSSAETNPWTEHDFINTELNQHDPRLFLTGKKICVFLSKGNFWTKIDVCPNIFFSFWGIHVMIRPICIWPSSSKSVNVKWSHDFWLLQCPRHTLLLHSNFQSFQVNFLSKSRCCCNTTFD